MKRSIGNASIYALIFAAVGVGAILSPAEANAAPRQTIVWCNLIAPQGAVMIPRKVQPHIITVGRVTPAAAVLAERPLRSPMVLTADERQHGAIIVRGERVSFARFP